MPGCAIRLERKFVLFPSCAVRGSFERTGRGRVGKEGRFTSTSPRGTARCAPFSCQPFGFLAIVIEINREKAQVRAIVLYELQRGNSSAQARRFPCEVVGSNAVTERTCAKWSNKFRSGNFNLDRICLAAAGRGCWTTPPYGEWWKRNRKQPREKWLTTPL